MKDTQKRPEYMLTYLCGNCGLDSGLTELEEAICRNCNEATNMKLISKEKIL